MSYQQSLPLALTKKDSWHRSMFYKERILQGHGDIIHAKPLHSHFWTTQDSTVPCLSDPCVNLSGVRSPKVNCTAYVWAPKTKAHGAVCASRVYGQKCSQCVQVSLHCRAELKLRKGRRVGWLGGGHWLQKFNGWADVLNSLVGNHLKHSAHPAFEASLLWITGLPR